MKDTACPKHCEICCAKGGLARRLWRNRAFAPSSPSLIGVDEKLVVRM